MDRFKEMEAFVAVVEAGSFVKAADHLRASKAAVSRNVLELETRLGARLLHRTTRRLSLTEAGQLYYERCRQILEDLDEADGVAGMSSVEVAGRIKVNVPLSFGISHLAPLWGPFMERYPRVELDITLNDRVVDLLEEGYDLAVRISRMADSSLVSRRLAATRMVLCASPQYLAAQGEPRTAAELVNHQILGYSYAPMGDNWQFESAAGQETVTVHSRLVSNNGDTCKAAALAHQGITWQPSFLVSRELARGALVRVLPQYNDAEIGIHAVYPSRKHLSAKVRALVDYLAECFARPDWESGGEPTPAGRAGSGGSGGIGEAGETAGANAKAAGRVKPGAKAGGKSVARKPA